MSENTEGSSTQMTPPVQGTQSIPGQLTPHTGVTITRVSATQNSAITRMTSRLNDLNWTVWQKEVQYLLSMCDVAPYVAGEINRPDPQKDPKLVNTWDYNNNYARILLTNNIDEDQKVHINQCTTSHEIWESLRAIHDIQGSQTAITYLRNIMHSIVHREDTNISDHCMNMKRNWIQMNQSAADPKYRIDDALFKLVVMSSLPKSWETFIAPYFPSKPGNAVNIAKDKISSHEMIGLIKEEYS